MNKSDKPKQETAFHSLTPDTVITLVEGALGKRCTNLCRPLISYINRVYELQAEDGSGLVAKFYRPGRWTQQGLQDEHDFLLELAGEEVPVVAPLLLRDSSSLGSYNNIHFAVFPKKGGRSFDEYNDDQWEELGRLLGRTHNIGAMHLPKDRLTMAPDISTRQQVDYILAGSFMPEDLLARFRDLTDSLIREITPLFDQKSMIRIHGDCHFSNLIYRPGESFHIIDFDDMVTGPPVQDFWMLLPGHREDSTAEIEIFLEGYETFRAFDMNSLRLIEPLRAMRYIHYTAWCAYQFAEDGETRVDEEFGSRHYWQTEMGDLEDQLERILKM
ncbi:MAG: serine/threonine protein kinase [Deltaproteobacteria bacterium]|jgi:Ser/Thr protein kinase RdoA (MazF antagonist)|nr:serine/threonine protein kinase [Deltaproteobacteria bacterium]